MRQRIRSHLTYANVVATLALFLVIAGGTAAAVKYVVSSNSQIGPNTISGHHPPSGIHANIIAGTIKPLDIARSGVDTCETPLVAKFGPICAGSDGSQRTFSAARNYCAGLGLRLPSLSEAITLAKNYNVPGGDFYFWTDEVIGDTGSKSEIVNEDGDVISEVQSATHQTVCVTDPSA